MYIRKSLITTLLLSFTFALEVTAFGATYYIDPTYDGSNRTGSLTNPFNNWTEVSFASGNTYLQKKGTTSTSGISLGGSSDILLGTYGDGTSYATIDGLSILDYGIKLFSSTKITIRGFRIKGAINACVMIIGSKDYLVEANECSNSLYGICVNVGKYGPDGVINNNIIHDTYGDGIGAWTLNPGVTIKNNHVYNFGNDGIDVLGSVGAIIENNTVHHSFDTKRGSRGTTHAGIKAGGNSGAGGGNNTVNGNIVYGVKNYGIYNRHAVGNVYINNYCYQNGVNFNFVNSDEPSLAKIEKNRSRDATYEAGLEYDVFIPPKDHLASTDYNKWLSAKVNVKNTGLYTQQLQYRTAMHPLEGQTVFSEPPPDCPQNLRIE